MLARKKQTTVRTTLNTNTFFVFKIEDMYIYICIYICFFPMERTTNQEAVCTWVFSSENSSFINSMQSVPASMLFVTGISSQHFGCSVERAACFNLKLYGSPVNRQSRDDYRGDGNINSTILRLNPSCAGCTGSQTLAPAEWKQF